MGIRVGWILCLKVESDLSSCTQECKCLPIFDMVHVRTRNSCDFFRFYVEIDHQKTSYSTQYFLKSLFQEMI